MIGRYAFSVLIGVVVTLSLLFIMQLLIASGKQALTDPRERHKLEFVRVKKNENLNTEDLTPEKPPKPPETPPETPPQDMDNIDPDAPSIDIPAPTVSADTKHRWSGRHEYRGRRLPSHRPGSTSVSSTGIISCLEGFVDLSFTVTSAGTVKDPIVLQSTSSLFERAATRAVLKFKYKPRVVDGVPVEVPGVKLVVPFS